MILEESLFEDFVDEPDFETIEKELKSIKGTTKVEFDYRPNDGVYNNPWDHFIVLVSNDGEFGEGLEYLRNRKTWKDAVVKTLAKLGWELEDPVEDNDTYLYLVMERKPIKEGYELLDGEKVEVYSDYHKAKNRARELGLEEAEYGNAYGYAYCYWNKSGNRNDTEEVIAYYTWGENGRPNKLTTEQKEDLSKRLELTFDDKPVKLKEDTDEIKKHFLDYLDKNYKKTGNESYEYIMYADYHDRLDDSALKSILSANNRMDAFYEYIYDIYDDYTYRSDIDQGFFDYLDKNHIEYTYDEVNEWLGDYSIDYIDVVPDFDFFLGQGVHTKLIINNGDSNYDFALNPCYANKYTADDEAGITWLVEQQGHTKEELQKALGEEKSDNKFMQSVVDECFNTSSSMNALTFIGECTLDELLNYKDGSKVKVSKDAFCGLVDSWYGAGSDLGIELEKDVIVPSDKVFYFGADEAFIQGYSVESIYGLTGKAWRGRFKLTESCGRKLVEGRWENKVPDELAKKFHEALKREDDSLEDLKDAIDSICDWIVKNYPDEEWEIKSIRDAWELVDLEDRYGDFLEDDEDDDRTNEDYVDEEIISTLYDELDSLRIWLPLEHEIKGSVSIDKINKELDIIGAKELSESKFTADLKESIKEIKCALNELQEKYFKEEK